MCLKKAKNIKPLTWRIWSKQSQTESYVCSNQLKNMARVLNLRKGKRNNFSSSIKPITKRVYCLVVAIICMLISKCEGIIINWRLNSRRTTVAFPAFASSAAGASFLSVNLRQCPSHCPSARESIYWWGCVSAKMAGNLEFMAAAWFVWYERKQFALTYQWGHSFTHTHSYI